MTETRKKGFTLIELLVVVLIIGILSAVALPQYQKAVNKSKTTQVLLAVRVIWDAEQIYYSINNDYTNDMSELDISFPPIKGVENTYQIYNGTCVLYAEKGQFLYDKRVTCSIKNALSFHRYFHRDKIMCCSYKTDNYSMDSFCQAETKSTTYHNWCGESKPCRCYEKGE